jgi:hypothetical protein
MNEFVNRDGVVLNDPEDYDCYYCNVYIGNYDNRKDAINAYLDEKFDFVVRQLNYE